jgi:hypothetical protein
MSAAVSTASRDGSLKSTGARISFGWSIRRPRENLPSSQVVGSTIGCPVGDSCEALPRTMFARSAETDRRMNVSENRVVAVFQRGGLGVVSAGYASSVSTANVCPTTTALTISIEVTIPHRRQYFQCGLKDNEGTGIPICEHGTLIALCGRNLHYHSPSQNQTPPPETERRERTWSCASQSFSRVVGIRRLGAIGPRVARASTKRAVARVRQTGRHTRCRRT